MQSNPCNKTKGTTLCMQCADAQMPGKNKCKYIPWVFNSRAIKLEGPSSTRFWAKDSSCLATFLQFIVAGSCSELLGTLNNDSKTCCGSSDLSVPKLAADNFLEVSEETRVSA